MGESGRGLEFVTISSDLGEVITLLSLFCIYKLGGGVIPTWPPSSQSHFKHLMKEYL